MRVDLKKFLFIGAEEEKHLFFRKAQEAGVVHFIDPKVKTSTSKELPQDIERVIEAIKILRHQPPMEQEENFDIAPPDELVEEILDLSHEKDKLEEDLRVLRLEIARVEVYGNFSLDDIAYIEREGKCKMQFYCSRPGLFRDVPMPEELLFIDSEHGLDYYVAINSEPRAYEKLIEMKIDQPVGMLRERYEALELELHGCEHNLKGFAKYSLMLHHALVDKLNKYDLYAAQSYVEETMEGMLFAVEGWVPVNKIAEMEKIVRDLHVYSEEVAIEPKDTIPTFLDNEGLSRLGEDLVSIYDTPSFTDKDPSPWVLGSFTLFFAFIIGDAGYGLIYLALALYLRYKFPNAKGVGKRVLDLFTVLCIGCIVWGVLTTSFFGIPISPDNPIRKVSIVQWLAEKKAAYHIEHQDDTYQEWVKKYPDLSKVKDPHAFVSYVPTKESKPEILDDFANNIMFELALFIGVIHVILSLGRYAIRNWHGIGWIAFLIGAYLYFAEYLDTPSMLNYVGDIDLAKGASFGLGLIIAGIAFAWIGSIIKHGFVGAFEVMTLIQLFADILSYLRLYALGLAGAIVSATVNEIAGIVPAIVAVFLIVISHFVNIILSTMSGIIHGLRLNFIEWYHYSFEGGGKKFQPLKLKDGH